MAIYFISDTHFGHKNILQYTDRHIMFGDNIEAHDEYLIEQWNSVVAPYSDEVWFLGDFAMGAKTRHEEIFNRLHGRKHLIMGNHDEQVPTVMSLPWESINMRKRLKHEGRRIVLDHYPILDWEGAHRGTGHCHGHTHGTIRQSSTRVDVGVDAMPYWRLGYNPESDWGKPVSWDEVWAFLDTCEFEVVSHHGANGER